MPTFNQLVRKGRKQVSYKSTSPALQKGLNTLKNRETDLSAPQKRYSALASVRYDISDDVRMTADLRHSRMYNDYIWFGDHDRGSLSIGLDNAFLPEEVRSAMLDAGASTVPSLRRMGLFFMGPRPPLSSPGTSSLSSVKVFPPS